MPFMREVFERIGDERIGEYGDIDSGNALVYLYRRFGFTPQGSDAYKRVCAYYVETPLKDTYLTFFIGGSQTFIGWTAKQNLFDRLDDDTEFAKQCKDAAEACLRDLLRPVFVRDVPITLLGKATTEELDQYDEAPRSRMAGYGVITECYEDPDVYFDFMKFVREQGGGDLIAGMKSILEQVRTRARELRSGLLTMEVTDDGDQNQN